MTAYDPVHVLLERSADRAPAATLLVHGGRRVAYGELESAANRMAAWLVARGVARGDRVGLLCENGADYVAGFFGILKAGGCVVALDPAAPAARSAFLLRDSGAIGLVTRRAQVRSGLAELLRGAPAVRLVVCDGLPAGAGAPAGPELATATDLAALPDARPNVAVGQQDLAAILYTSGSTGRPRGVTLLHRNLAANTRQILAYLELTADDSVLVVLPFHYSFGKSLLLTHVAVGGRLVVDNRFAYPATVLDTLEREAVSGLSGVPATYAILCARTDFLARPHRSLRYLTQAGGAMSPTLTMRLREALPEHVRIFVMYGQTEASARLSRLPPERLREKLGSIGLAIPGVRLTVRRDDGAECAPGEVGEIVAEGDNIMRGYWNDPEETARVLRDGRLWTGDLARRDGDGFLWVVDRRKNMIKSGAHRVSAREVEDTIAELPGVAEVCVVGVPDELLGEAIEAFVVPAGGETGPGRDAGASSPLDERTILRHCAGRLAAPKLPRRVTFLASLPRGSAGKVRKKELVRLAAAAAAGPPGGPPAGSRDGAPDGEG